MPHLAITKTVSQKALSSQELSSFCQQLSLILKSGITLNEGLSIVSKEYEHSSSGQLLQFLSEKMDEGKSLSLALEKSQSFPNYMVKMVAIGEQTGRLDDVLDSLCKYYERDSSIKSSIKSAVFYPLMMIAMMLCIVGVLVIKVLPVFQNVYHQLGGELSSFSKSLINVGVVFSKYSTMIAFLLACVVGFVIFLYFTKNGSKVLHKFLEKFFLTKKLCYLIGCAKFSIVLSLMISSGLDLISTLKQTLMLVNNQAVNSKIEHCLQLTLQGESFGESISKSQLFTPMESKMISVGFKTGTSDVVIHKLAEKYTQKVDQNLTKIISIIEPTLVAILSIIVGLILLSVMLPLMGILSSI